MEHRILTHPMAARERFRKIVELPDRMIDLTEAALVIALEEYPSLQLGRYLDQIDEWGEAIRDRVEGSHDVEGAHERPRPIPRRMCPVEAVDHPEQCSLRCERCGRRHVGTVAEARAGVPRAARE